MKPKTTARFYWSLTVLFCLLMLVNGASSLMHEPAGVAALKQLGYPAYILDITGVAKILGALALLQNKYRTLKEWAFAGFVIDFVGAAASVLFVGMGVLATLPALVMLTVVLGLHLLWQRYRSTRQVAEVTERASTYEPVPVI